MSRIDKRFLEAFQACLDCRTGDLLDIFSVFLDKYAVDGVPTDAGIAAFSQALKPYISQIMGAASGDPKEYANSFWDVVSQAADAYDAASE